MSDNNNQKAFDKFRNSGHDISIAAFTRRRFLQAGIVGLAIPILGMPISPYLNVSDPNTNQRDFSVCLTPDTILDNPGLLKIIASAGVNRVWLATFCYGYWPWSIDDIKKAHHKILSSGLMSSSLTLSLGHPGDALGAKDDKKFQLTPPLHWPRSVDIDGDIYSGTNVSAVATKENSYALKSLRDIGFQKCILDDDFRLARGPGLIGGNYDILSQNAFIKMGGYAATKWEQLLDDVRNRRLSSLLRSWVNWQCDQLTESFRIQQKAFDADLGLMVMYLGAEKAGIRLADYKDVSMRVGEFYFSDESLSSPKGWTDELFSVLFHRRFVSADRAWSETTSFPANAVSTANMAAKLVVSTIADVRHTTFMSGFSPLPEKYWAILTPAIANQKKLHQAIAGHRPRGPFKHFWGEASRFVGQDKPFSLWLSLGVPFEVITDLNSGNNGWVFLSNEDCGEVANNDRLSRLIARPDAISKTEVVIQREHEDLSALWKWRQSIIKEIQDLDVPYVVEESPCICAWYPSAGCVIIWNLSNETRKLTLNYKSIVRTESFLALEAIKVMI